MALSRCGRCERLFSLCDELDQCCYHPGQHRRLGWTCCRDPSVSAPGCRMGVHLEDAMATAAMDDLWFRSTVQVERADSNISEPAEADVVVFEDPSGTMCVAQQHGSGEAPAAPAARSLGLTAGAASLPGETPAVDEPAAADSSPAIGDGGADETSVLVPYLVGPFDTFSAICMRYKMEPEELQRVNGLRRRYARPGSTVLVWAERSAGAVQEEMQRTLILAFRRRCKCSVGEARYYLETSAYNMENAIQHRQEELHWEGSAQGEAAAHQRLPPPTASDDHNPDAVKSRSRQPPRGILSAMTRCVRCVPARGGAHAPMEL